MKLQSTIKRFGILALALTAPTLASMAGTMDYSSKQSKQVEVPPPAPELCFEAGETTFDVFGGYIWAEGEHDDAALGGIGVNHFFTEMLGLGVSGFIYDGDSAIWNFDGSVIVRFPIQEICLAPYIYGGGGYVTNSENYYTAHAGAGVEYRFSDTIGVFADGRYTWAFEDDDQSDDLDTIMARAGLRFAF